MRALGTHVPQQERCLFQDCDVAAVLVLRAWRVQSRCIPAWIGHRSRAAPDMHISSMLHLNPCSIDQPTRDQ